MTETSPGLAQLFQAPDDPEAFDAWDPANVSPVVAYLASASCEVSGRVFAIQGGTVQLFEPWKLGSSIDKPGRWTIDELVEAMPRLLR